MNGKSSCGVWCWVIYALPCLCLLAWSGSGHALGESLSLLVWLYGFPSTALLQPLLPTAWTATAQAEVFTICLVGAVANGALICLTLHLVRAAMRPERPEESLPANLDVRLNRR